MEAEADPPESLTMQKLLSAFKIFVKEVKNDFAGKAAYKGQSLAAGLSEMWRKLSEKEKQAYYDKYAEQKRKEHQAGPVSVESSVPLVLQRIEPLGSGGEMNSTSSRSSTFASGDASSSHLLQTDLKVAAADGGKLAASQGQQPQPTAKPKRQRTKKDEGGSPSKKRAPNAFMLFATEMRKKVPGLWTGRQAISLLADRWRRMADPQKDRFYQQSMKLREEKLEQESGSTNEADAGKKPKTKRDARKRGSRNNRKESSTKRTQRTTQCQQGNKAPEPAEDFRLVSPSPQPVQPPAVVSEKKDAVEKTDSSERKKAAASASPKDLPVPTRGFPSPCKASTTAWPTMTPPMIDQVFVSEMTSRSRLPSACACRNMVPPAASPMWPTSSLSPYSYFPHTMNFGGMSYPYMGSFPSMPHDATFWMFRHSMYQPTNPCLFYQPPFIGGPPPSFLGAYGGCLENAMPQLRAFEATGTTENDSNLMHQRDDDSLSSGSNDLVIDVVDHDDAEEAVGK